MSMSRGAYVAASFACAALIYLEWFFSRHEIPEAEFEATPSPGFDDSPLSALKEAGWTIAAIVTASLLSLATKARWKRQAAERRQLAKLASSKTADATEESQQEVETVQRSQMSQAQETNAAEARANRELILCLRKCLTERSFKEGLASYDRAAKSIGAGCKTVWSILLYCAVEIKEFWRCEDFIWLLVEAGDLNSNDFVNTVRYYVNAKDAVGLTGVLCAMRRVDYAPDVIARNRALAGCLAAGDAHLAETLIEGTSTVALDVVAYNTLIRLYGHHGDLTRCNELIAEMQVASLRPTDMTFGILIDACVKSGDIEGAYEAFKALSHHGLQPNVVHYTTLIQGLVCAQRLDEAERLLDEMLVGGSTTPDVVTYSTLMKAYSEKGAIEPSIRLLKRMLKQGLEPDCVIFNTALNACSVKAMKPAEILSVFDNLVELGLRPTNATLSGTIKALARAEGYVEAIGLLGNCPSRFGYKPAPRVFEQLLRACQAAGRSWEADQVEALAWTQRSCGATQVEAWRSSEWGRWGQGSSHMSDKWAGVPTY